MSATTAYLKPLSMADCILSLNKPSLPFIQIPSKSVKICLSHSLSTVSVSSHSPIFSSYKILSYSKKPLGILVARTSDWAQQDAQSEVDEVGFDWDKSIVEEPEARTSEWEDQSEVENNENDANDESDEPFVEPPEDAKLFVGNIPYDMDSENLAKLFDQAGIVEVAEVIYNRETDQSRGFGFVTMSTVEEAEKAIEMFHRYDVNGRLLTVNKAAPKGSRPERPREFRSSFRIYVGNLPWQVDNSRLEQVFSEHGEVVTARVVYDRESGRSRGFGFVTMSSQNDLDAAIAALDGQTLDGRQIRVNVAEDRPPTRGNF